MRGASERPAWCADWAYRAPCTVCCGRAGCCRPGAMAGVSGLGISWTLVAQGRGLRTRSGHACRPPLAPLSRRQRAASVVRGLGLQNAMHALLRAGRLLPAVGGDACAGKAGGLGAAESAARKLRRRAIAWAVPLEELFHARTACNGLAGSVRLGAGHW